ncbi:MAG: tyrosine--tRNA ligase [Oligoflexia bacterium]|nr:tyrosine--tRNA ligase [Oligoflexia bacterium]
MYDLYTDLVERGIIENTSSEKIKDLLNQQKIAFYAGYDPTFKSLQIGNLFAIVTMKRLQQAGHRPIVLVGGATGMIGDPSGKNSERNLLDEETISANLCAQEKQLRKLLDFENPDCGAMVVNNYDWFKGMNLIHFLRDVGKSFRLSEMLAKDSVKSRLNSEVGISFTEFTYQILQAYDFVFLFKEHGALLQLGGSDQWGNITAGIDLIRKTYQKEAYGLVIPLVTDSQGKKFGKSEGGTVYLDPEITSPYKMYQYLLNTEDSIVIKYLKYYSFLSLPEIAELEHLTVSAPEKREAQKVLAREVTKYVHGEEGLLSAENATKIFFGEKIGNTPASELLSIFMDVPSITLESSKIDAGINILDLLSITPLYKSKGEARRAIAQNGVYINNDTLSNPELIIGKEHFIDGKLLILRKGKKNYCLVSI